MKIIIYGAGEIANLVAKEFYQANDIIIIDKEENKIDELNRLDISFINCDSLTLEILKNAGIKTADVFIACTASDELNIVASFSAKKIAPIKTICFVTKEEYKTSLGLTRDSEYSCQEYIDHIIWPEDLLTKEIFQIVTVENALNAESFAKGRAKLLEYKLEEDSILVGKQIKACDFPSETLIVGITRSSDLFIPNGETVLEEDDRIIFMGLSSALSILAARFFHEKNYKKSIAIIGGGNVGYILAKNLEKTKIQIKIIEKSLARCEYLSEGLSNTLVINGDGTNLELLNQEEIGEMDVVISVTNNDEKNLLCALLAKQLGVKRVISRVSTIAHIPMFEKVGIDIAMSSNGAALHEIKNILSKEHNIDILATVDQGQGEVLEVNIEEAFKEVKLMNLNLPRRAIIGIIHRKNKVIIPKGDTLVRGGDDLIIFTTKDSASVIKDFFKVN